MPDKKSKLNKVDKVLTEVEQAAEIGKQFAPPGIRGRVQDVEDAIEVGRAGAGVVSKLFNLFKKKKG